MRTVGNRRMYLYRTSGIDEDTEPLVRAMVEYTALLRKLHGENFELGTIIQPEGARMPAVPGVVPGMYVYTDTRYLALSRASSGMSSTVVMDSPTWVQLSLFDQAEVIWDVTPEPGYAGYRCPECGEYGYLPTSPPRRRCVLTKGCPGRAERVE